ncbi:hypothetical protein ACMZ4W_00071 [Brevundimonas naejangsanensis]
MESSSRPGHVVELHQPHTGHFPNSGASGVGERVLDRNFGFNGSQKTQSLADPILIHQSQRVQPSGVRLDEPVASRRRCALHFSGHSQIALVIARRQRIKMRDRQIATIVRRPCLRRQATVPQSGPLEIALIQKRPGDMVQAIQPLAVASPEGLMAKSLKGVEVRAHRPLLDRASQFDGRRRRRRIGLYGRLGDSDRGRRNARENEAPEQNTALQHLPPA